MTPDDEFWTDRLLQILKGSEAEGRRTESSSGSLRAASDTRDMPKDIATLMADGILAPASVKATVAVWQPITKRGRNCPLRVSRL